jgi:glyoxylase-like metal-dependent hydrolase (beta-lactamase superfamily II)
MTQSIRITTPVIETRLSRRRFLSASALAAAGAVFDRTFLQAYAAPPAQVGPQISVTDLGGLFLFQGAGCNVIAMHGDDGALMIDGGLAANAGALLTAVKQRTANSRINTLINTHWHPEQTGANEAVGRDGGIIIAHEKTRMYLSNTVTSVTFEGRLAPLPEVARPNKTTQQGGSLQFAGQQVDYAYLPQAHTDGDLYVHFPGLNVLAAGGVVSGEQWPLLDYRNGAWFGGRVRAFERLAKLVRSDTRVVPAHGRMITGSDIVRLNDIYQKLNVEMFAYMNMGLGPEDVAARNPLKQYQAEFGDASAFLYGEFRSMLIAYVPELRSQEIQLQTS